MKKVFIFGAGQLGIMVSYILSYRQDIKVVGLIDDDPNQKGKTYNGIEVLGTFSCLTKLRNAGCVGGIVSIGNNEARGNLGLRIKKLGFELINAIHPTAIVSKLVKIGQGVIIGSGVNLYVNPIIGNSVFIGPSVVVSHDTVVGDNALLSVGSVIGARIDIHKNAFIGSGATIMPPGWGKESRLTVGQNAIVGVGAVVIHDVPPKAVVAGIPAKVLRIQKSEGPKNG